MPTFRVWTAEATTVVQPGPRAFEEAHIHTFGDELFRLADGMSTPQVWVDLTDIRFITSTAMGKLIALHQRLVAQGKRLVLDKVAGLVYEAFAVCRLDTILDIRATPALAAS